MAQPTAQKLETTNCRKIDNGNPNNSANTDTGEHRYNKNRYNTDRL